MKLSRCLFHVGLCLTLAACQTPLYTAVESKNVYNVKRELASGADPYETAPANWLWKLPVLPVTYVVDMATILTTIGTLGLYGLLHDAIFGDDARYLTHMLLEYGSVSPVDKAMSWKNWDKQQAEICYALAESGKVRDKDFLLACLKHALNAGAFDVSERLVSKGVRPTDKMLMDALRDGDAAVAEFLVKSGGMSVNSPLGGTSYQFIAQEAGQMPLYRSLGGIEVAQPVAPPIDCPMCVNGIYKERWVDCKDCMGGSKMYYTTEYVSSGYVGADPNDTVNTWSMTPTTVVKSSPCSTCNGVGDLPDHIMCGHCNGVGSFPRYAQ